VAVQVEPLSDQPSARVLRLQDVTPYHTDAADARDQIRRRDEFLAMLSHELRNPLAAIQNASSILARGSSDALIRQRASDVLNRQMTHMTRMLDDLLDVTRISRGKLDLRIERVDIHRILHDAADAVLAPAQRQGHDLRVSLPPEPLWLQGDATRLEQVAVNLLTNAVKFTPPGGRIELQATQEDDHLTFQVRDNGPGIPAELLPHIFEPFVQGPQTLDRQGGGLGIGLALASNLVRLHGGTLTAQPNQPGPGTTFTVRLPANRSESAAPGLAARSVAHGRQILVVEDNDDARTTLVCLLQMDGHKTLEAADGPSAVEAILKHRPEIALIDLGLPGFDGFEIARRVREQWPEGPIRLVALTGYGMPSDVDDTHAAGFDAHLLKPVTYHDLCKVMMEPGRPQPPAPM
jgi:two-component system CheB/CheR fusion protein